MNLNPALAKIVAAANTKYEAAIAKIVADAEANAEANSEQARELLLNLIGNTLERIHATPSGEVVDYQQEATDLLEMVERWCLWQHEDGYLIFHNPREGVVTLEP
ncbi:hypothetical protein LB524_21395 [Mesorhizobium sp. ESP6-5]|uniref:hypothetical protein n=1 Tax=Mesorhizobium sp. ESP6-5 TaxID=2876623 RepID=UPI001CCE9CB1|nr:hypothetical protein [Mesorhizobium sp. ESP6-5]MBZ9757845.1 hypothetical protein [Mesorhizobium sp. ESP6-5]